LRIAPANRERIEQIRQTLEVGLIEAAKIERHERRLALLLQIERLATINAAPGLSTVAALLRDMLE
jgi:hypothetical protein